MNLQNSISAFLNNLKSQIGCEIQFIPYKNQEVEFFQKNSLIYKDGKMGVPLFFKEEFYGCFLVSCSHLNDRQFELLGFLIQEGMQDIFTRSNGEFHLEHLIPASSSDNNILPLFKAADSLEYPSAEPNILFVSGSSEEEIMHSAMKIHNETGHMAFLQMNLLMKKEGSFQDWTDLHFSTLFFPDWMASEDWQKQQLRDFISESKSRLPFKIIIGLRGENLEWKIS